MPVVRVEGEKAMIEMKLKVQVRTVNPHITLPKAVKMSIMNILSRAIFSGNLEIVIKPPDQDN